MIRIFIMKVKRSNKKKSMWCIYIIRCRNGSLYTGITTDVTRRFQEHQSSNKGARYLRGRGPLSLVFSMKVGNRSLASKIERKIKQLPKNRKEKLVTSEYKIGELIGPLASKLSSKVI